MNGWIGELFHPRNVDRTVDLLVGHQPQTDGSSKHDRERERLADAEVKLKRFRDAIAAGVDASTLADGINEAQADKAAAEAALASVKRSTTLPRAEVYVRIDSLGDIGAALKSGNPDSLAKLYGQLHLEMLYDNEKKALDVRTSLRVNNERVRGES